MTSYATNVDQSAEAPLADAGTTVDELEAAALGDGWYETDIALDPCFGIVEVAVLDQKVAQESFGLGCSISVTKDFEGDPWNAGITLVHEAGWTPDHVLDVASDDTVVWDELPSGDYTVFEYMGAVDGTFISIDGGPAVPHAGEPVPVEVGQDVLVFNPDVTLDLTDVPDPTDPTMPEDTDPTVPEDTDPTVPDDSDPTDPTGPRGDLPETGSNSTGALAAGALVAGLAGPRLHGDRPPAPLIRPSGGNWSPTTPTSTKALTRSGEGLRRVRTHERAGISCTAHGLPSGSAR